MTREWRNYWTLAGERTPSVIDLDRVLQGEQSVTIDFSIAPNRLPTSPMSTCWKAG